MNKWVCGRMDGWVGGCDGWGGGMEGWREGGMGWDGKEWMVG